MQPRLVDRPADLPAALADIADLDPVGVDVERADWDRYWRRAALIQVGGDGRVALVDPMTIDDLAALHHYLDERLVVLHAMENDLAPLKAAGVRPSAVADTAVAAGILGLPVGLEALLHDLLGITLESDKQAMQRADWEARPLDAEMLWYAAEDVADLPALWELLRDRLESAGRLAWYEEEIEAQLAQPAVEDRRHWARVKGIGRLDPDGQGRARALWEVREQLAQDTDTAPGRILNDKVLIGLAQDPPPTARDLVRRGLRRQAARRFSTDLMEALDGATPLPARRRDRRVTDADRKLAETLRETRAEVANDLGIDPGLLCPNRTLMTAVLTDPETPAALKEALGLRDWQWAQVGDRFSEAFGFDGAGKASSTDDRPPEEDPRA
jgi:ribonuclease D